MGPRRNNDHTEIAERLRRFRLASGITQLELANVMQISSASVGMIESDHRDPQVDALIRLCQVYGLTLDFIFRGSKAGLASATLDVVRKAERLDESRRRADQAKPKG